MPRYYEVKIPEELKTIDERCKVWARVTADRPFRMETTIYKAMVMYGGYKPEVNPQDPEPLPPLSEAQIKDAWTIDRAWRSPLLIQTHKNALMLWYFVAGGDVIFAAKTLRCRNSDVQPRILAALTSIKNIVTTFDKRRGVC